MSKDKGERKDVVLKDVIASPRKFIENYLYHNEGRDIYQVEVKQSTE